MHIFIDQPSDSHFEPQLWDDNDVGGLSIPCIIDSVMT